MQRQRFLQPFYSINKKEFSVLSILEEVYILVTSFLRQPVFVLYTDGVKGIETVVIY